jgi:PAS domain S-box-containing protein
MSCTVYLKTVKRCRYVKLASEIRVLHVDDDKCFLTLAKAILSGEGPFNIETATSPEEALTKLHKDTFDVIISDYEMPQKNGLEFFKLLRENGFKTPFILFTGKGREEIVVQALNLGVDRYINKIGDTQTVYTELSVAIKQLHEQNSAQKLLWEHEERFKQMVTNSKDLTMLTDSDGAILYLSPSCKEILGYAPEELIGKVPWIIHPDDLEQVQSIFQASLTTPVNGTLEYRIITKQGETKWINHSFSQIIENDKLKQVVSSIKDVTESKKDQAKLLESEKRFRLVVENSPIVLANLNRDLQYTWAYNSHIKQFVGDDLLGKKLGEAAEIEDFDEIRKELAKILEKGGSIRREITVNPKGKEKIYLDSYFEAARDSNGEIIGLYYTAYNINERKSMENQLAFLEERWHFALEGAEDGVWDWNPQTNQAFLSSQWKKMLGYDENDLENTFQQWYTLLHPEDKQRVINEVNRHLAGETPFYKAEYRLLTKDGVYKWVLSRGKVINRTPDGRPLRVIGTQTDITERIKAEMALQESEEKFSAAFNFSGAAIAVTRLNDGLFVEVNDCFLKTFGYNREEVIGKTTMLLGLYVDMNERQKIIDLTLNNQSVINREVKFVRKDKKVITGLFSTKIINVKGKKHLLTTLIDITDLKKAEKALFLQKNELENFISMAPDPITILDLNAKIIQSNELARKTFGYTKEEVIGKDGFSFISEKDRMKMDAILRKTIYDRQVHTSSFTGKHKNGVEICLEGSVKAVFDQQDSPTAFIAIIRDVTERKLTEQKLQESEERYRFVAEHAQDLITISDRFGNFTYVSPSVLNLTGFTAEELVGKKDIFELIHPEDKPIVNSNSRQLLDNKSTSPIEIRLFTKNGSYIWIESNVSTVKDATGTNKFMSISRNITERRLDREEKNMALNKAEMLVNKLSVVGGFVRHDVRNKLVIIASTLYLSKKYSTGNVFMQQQMEKISSTVDNIARILDFAQTYEAAGSKGLSWLNVNKAVNDSKILCPDLNIIKVQTENVEFDVLADSALVEIFHNLIDNSIKYGKDLSSICISGKKDEKGNVQLVYEDNGGGIDLELKPRLFQKGAGKGTGLGLYLIQRICEIYGWQVYENGEHGKGVRFVLEIPEKLTRPTIKEQNQE